MSQLKDWIEEQIFEKYRPHEHPSLARFQHIIMREDLWHVNRHSVSRATGIGLFSAFIPIPFQMVLALFLALFLRGNVLISMALVWITNPLTMGPIFYICYLVGLAVLGGGSAVVTEEAATWEWFSSQFANIWEPFLLGCLIIAVTSAFIGYFAVKLAWRIHLLRHLKERASRSS